MTTSVFFCAGEPSGDILGAELARALQQKNPNVQLRGMGSQHLKNAGVKLVLDSRELAIVGAWEAIKQLPQIRKAMQLVVNDLKQNPPDYLVLIDYPGFNLRLAKIAKNLGIRVLYYSCPQIWAWHYSRIKKIKRYCDHMLTLFPFEKTMYDRENMPATFVGHPMVQRIAPTLSKAAALAKYNLDANRPIIALVPGSRRSEINNLFSDIVSSAILISQKIPNAQFIMPIAENFNPAEVKQAWNAALTRHCKSSKQSVHTIPIQFITENRYDALQCADAAIAVSGTVTLELALLQIPLVIIYRVSLLTYYLGKIFVHAPYLGLCNIVADAPIAKELMQKQATPENISAEIIELITNQQYRQTILQQLQKLKIKMGDQLAAEQAAELII